MKKSKAAKCAVAIAISCFIGGCASTHLDGYGLTKNDPIVPGSPITLSHVTDINDHRKIRLNGVSGSFKVTQWDGITTLLKAIPSSEHAAFLALIQDKAITVDPISESVTITPKSNLLQYPPEHLMIKSRVIWNSGNTRISTTLHYDAPDWLFVNGAAIRNNDVVYQIENPDVSRKVRRGYVSEWMVLDKDTISDATLAQFAASPTVVQFYGRDFKSTFNVGPRTQQALSDAVLIAQTLQ